MYKFFPRTPTERESKTESERKKEQERRLSSTVSVNIGVTYSTYTLVGSRYTHTSSHTP